MNSAVSATSIMYVSCNSGPRIIADSVSNDEARRIFGTWKEPKPYIRIAPQPGADPGA